MDHSTLRRDILNYIKDQGYMKAISLFADMMDDAGKHYLAGRLDQLGQDLKDRGYTG
jgi:hypothetical protein